MALDNIKVNNQQITSIDDVPIIKSDGLVRSSGIFDNCCILSDDNITYDNYLNGSGYLVHSTGWLITDYIDVSGISTIHVNYGKVTTWQAYAIAYDSNKNKVNDFGTNNIRERDITISSNFNYFRFSFYYLDDVWYAKNVSNNAILFDKTHIEIKPVNEFYKEISEIKLIKNESDYELYKNELTTLSALQTFKSLYDIKKDVGLNSHGDEGENIGWGVTDYISLEDATSIIWYCGKTSTDSYTKLILYNENFNQLNYISASTLRQEIPLTTHIINKDAKYVRASFYISSENSMIGIFNQKGKILFNRPSIKLKDESEIIESIKYKNNIGDDWKILASRSDFSEYYNKSTTGSSTKTRLTSSSIEAPCDSDLIVFTEEGYHAEVLLLNRNNDTVTIEGRYGQMLHNTTCGYVRVYISSIDGTEVLFPSNPPIFFLCYKDKNKEEIGSINVLKTINYVLGSRQSSTATTRIRSGFIEIPEDAISLTVKSDSADTFGFLVYGIKGDVTTEEEEDIQDMTQWLNNDQYLTKDEVYTFPINIKTKYIRLQFYYPDGSSFDISTFETKSSPSYLYFNIHKGVDFGIMDFNVASYNVCQYWRTNESQEVRDRYVRAIFREYLNELKSLIVFVQEDCVSATVDGVFHNYYEELWKPFYKYHYCAGEPWGGIYSKLPLYREGHIEFSPLHDWSDEYSYPYSYPRTYAIATTKINGRKVLLVSWHGGIASNQSREDEAVQLIAWLEEKESEGYSHVIMGADSNSMYGQTFELFKDAGFQVSNWGYWGGVETCGLGYSHERIDSIYTKGFNLNSMDIKYASVDWRDHHPVVSNINMEI